MALARLSHLHTIKNLPFSTIFRANRQIGRTILGGTIIGAWSYRKTLIHLALKVCKVQDVVVAEVVVVVGIAVEKTRTLITIVTVVRVEVTDEVVEEVEVVGVR